MEGIRNLFEAMAHTETVGLDYFGVGEQRTVSMLASPPGA